MGRITASRKQLTPDPRHDSMLASKFVNCLMHDGKKSTAQAVFYSAMDVIQEKIPDQPPIDVFTQAVENCRPAIEVRSKRVGGANYQIPFEVKGQRQNHLTIMWFVAAARARKGIPMADRLAAELMDAYNQQGTAVKKREDVHKMAEANRAFAHFARF